MFARPKIYSSTFVTLDGKGGVSLICSVCVDRAEVKPAYRIVSAPTDAEW